MLSTEIEHLLGFADPANPGTGQLTALHQQTENLNRGRFGRGSHLAESSPYPINDPWLSCRLEAKALIEQGFEPASDIGPSMRFIFTCLICRRRTSSYQDPVDLFFSQPHNHLRER
jgi:hypothetical protein